MRSQCGVARMFARSVCLFIPIVSGLAIAEVVGQSTPLQAPVASTYPELSPCISKDGLSLYFASYRPGGVGESDIYVATRPSPESDWDAVENVGLRVNTSASEWGPCISADGLKLYFSSDRADGYGGHDLWVTMRNSPQSDWSPALNLGPEINTAYDEVEPCVSIDESELYFSDSIEMMRPDGLQLYVATRVAGAWSSPTPLGQEIDVGLEAGPCISADGLTLLYGGAVDVASPWSLYAARRATTAEPFGSPVQLNLTSLPMAAAPAMPSLSADQKTLYFTAGYVDTGESWDLWQSELTPLVDFNGDGRISDVELFRMAGHWGTDDLAYDIAPMPAGNGVVDTGDLALLAAYATMDSIKDPTLVGYWKLDGNPDMPGIACDSSENCCHGTLVNGACLVPDAGVIGGALACDGMDDYVQLPAAFSPGDGEMSVFTWVISGGRPGVILSQRSGHNWLMVDLVSGGLKTGLQSKSRFRCDLMSSTGICDGDWHEIGFVWDGTNRRLYIDGEEVAHDTQRNLADCCENLYIGAGQDLSLGTFWRGFIDEVRIYSRVIEP